VEILRLAQVFVQVIMLHGKIKKVIEKVIQFFKRYWIFIVLATVASSLLVFRLSQREQPSLEPQPTPAPQIKLSPPQISGVNLPRNSIFSISDFSFPPRLKIYQGSESKISSDQAVKIAREFGFSGSPQESEDVFLGNFYTWATKTKFLSIALNSNTINHGLDLSQSQLPTKGALPSPETAKTTLENLLENLGLSPQFELKWQKEDYLVNRYSLPFVNNPKEADFIKVGFNPAVGQYQMIGLEPNEPLVSLVLDKEAKLISFSYQLYFSSLEDLEIYDLKDNNDVQALLITEGKIVYSDSYEEIVKIPNFVQAEFNQITLAYYQDPDKNPIIQPIYILSGQGTLESGEKTEIIAYLPAIKFGTQTPQNQEVPREFFQLPELP